MTSASEEIPCYPNTNYYVDEKGVLHIDNVKGYRMVTEHIRNAIRDVCGDPEFALSDDAWDELIKDAEK